MSITPQRLYRHRFLLAQLSQGLGLSLSERESLKAMERDGTLPGALRGETNWDGYQFSIHLAGVSAHRAIARGLPSLPVGENIGIVLRDQNSRYFFRAVVLSSTFVEDTYVTNLRFVGCPAQTQIVHRRARAETATAAA